jgi:hypothetical protein
VVLDVGVIADDARLRDGQQLVLVDRERVVDGHGRVVDRVHVDLRHHADRGAERIADV